MKKVIIGNHELEFDQALIEEFEQSVCDSFESSAESHLATNFHEEDLEKVFREHTEEEITAMIIKTAKQEIALYKGEI